MSELLDGVDACGLEKLSELRTDTLDSVEVSVVCPGEDELAGDAGLVLKSLAACRGCALGEELVSGLMPAAMSFSA